MDDLERTSHAAATVRGAEPGRLRHPPCQALPRHPHAHGFAALVLRGGYVEAGDTGRHRMEAGDVLLHQAWESHLDRFDARGAEVLVLAIDDRDAAPVTGRVADPDAIARLADRDRDEAARQLRAALAPRATTQGDWPDLLAQALRADPTLPLTPWARERGLHLGSLSRGFRQVFGVTPVAYRLVQRTRRAMAAVRVTREPLSFIAQ
ncbi:MAG: hypothetical protein ACXWKR_08660, partial [Phenylobacterium sp.]